jgi:hypothetical protein
VQRQDFEHVIAAAANVSGEDEFVVIGSQAVLGSFPDPPDELLQSMEADIYPAAAPDKADLIDGALGDGSPFHESFGYYAHAVGPETAKAPEGWRDRLVRVPIRARVGSERSPVALCLEPHDLVLSKCVAGRDRGWQFAAVMIRAQLVDPEELLARVPSLPVEARERGEIVSVLNAMTAGASDR